MLHQNNPVGKRVLFITYNLQVSTRAPSLNTVLRKRAMESAGYSVDLYSCERQSDIVRDLVSLLPRARSYKYIYIRIDGSGLLEVFTLLRFLSYRTKIIWEIHAWPDERFYNSRSLLTRMQVTRDNVVRKLLSNIVHAYIFPSNTLAHYSAPKLAAKQFGVVPNFYQEEVTVNTQNVLKEFKLKKGKYWVFWEGNARHRWHALDIIERVAQKIYYSDKNVEFCVIGSEPWYSFSWGKNITFIPTVSKTAVMQLLRRADICLALYHETAYLPRYFSPLKILDYSILGKAIIASDSAAVKEIISDGQEGLLTDNSVDDVYNKILYIKRNNRVGFSLGKNARRNVQKRFSLSRAAELYKATLSRV